MEFHPLADEFPLMTDEELSFLVADMQANGFDADQPIVTFEGAILDGRDRYRAANAAGIEPIFKEFDGLDPEAFVRRRNEDRKHMADLVQRRRAARVERVADHKRAGMSNRAIAEEEEISETQVRRDLAQSTAPGGGAVEPPNGKVTGKDGKKRPAKVTPPTPTDAWGIPIQEHAAEAFEAVPEFKELISAIRNAQKLFDALANRTGGRFLTLPAVSSYKKGSKDEEGRYIHRGLEDALRDVKKSMPAHTVCPWDHVSKEHPEKCPTCLGLHWTPALSDSADVAKERAQKAYGVEE